MGFLAGRRGRAVAQINDGIAKDDGVGAEFVVGCADGVALPSRERLAWRTE